MRVAQVLERVRLLCPGFATVGHALTSAATIARPAALIGPAKLAADPALFYGPGIHAQELTAVFAVYVLIDRRQDDDTGAGAADEFDDLMAELRGALAGWTPDGAHTEFQIVGGTLDRFQDGLVCWREDYTTRFEFSQPTALG